MSITLKLTMVLCLTAAIASSAAAAPLVWTGAAGDNNWMTAGNWDTGSAPGQTSGSPDSVTFGVQGINSASHTIGGNTFYLNAITVGAPGSPPDFGTGTKYLANATSGGKIVLQAAGATTPTITAYMLPGTDPAATRNLFIAAPIELQADTHVKRVGTVLPYTRTFYLSGPITGTGNLTIESGSASYAAAINLYGDNSFTGNVTILGGSIVSISRGSGFGNPANQVTFGNGGTCTFDFSPVADGSVIPNNIALPTDGSAVNPYWTWNDAWSGGNPPAQRDATLSGNITGGRAGSTVMGIYARDSRRLFLAGTNSFFGNVAVTSGSELIIGGANASGIALENAGTIMINGVPSTYIAPEHTTGFLIQGSYTLNSRLQIDNITPSAVIQPVATIGQMNNGATAYDATFTGKIDVREQDYQALNLYAEAGGSARFTGNIFNNVANGQGFSVNRSFDEIEGAPRRYGSPTGTVILDTSSRVALTDGGTGPIGPVNVARGTLQVDTDHFYASTVSIAPEATLAGTGRVSAAVTLSGTHAPGNSVGSQTVGSAAWLPGGKFEFEINDAGGAAGGGLAGLGWDLLAVGDGAGAGTLDLRGLSSASPFEIHVASLNGASAGNAANFVATQPYDWVFVTYDELVDDYFAPDLFTLNTDDFSNGTGEGYFAITQVPNGLAVSFIPEPGTLAMTLTALALLLCRRRRT